MKDKVPWLTLGISICSLVVIAIILLFLNQPNAILTLFAVVILSVVYLCGMEKNHNTFMRHRKR
ncbi:hypothetical protein [Companilactobacillus halodurans]|uniref:Uncharacterized protein n=1 Tax=Companilactobacillus halodurans TaxID=2584183 RepID=A0A5P0ZMF4_9LACO|nr:hypothetical protein [Companilactobacillus halodurans]MQS75403.1 hypothetical protein [Companilactobacillus halodurans]MQS97349.1 hypothetical protein [Companilactobacillus halodurans]